jgi:hypothetical protein
MNMNYKTKVAIACVVGSLFAFAVTAYASTTIGTDIETGGNFTLASSTSALIFGNNWSIDQTSATTSQITVEDSGGNPVLIFDQN